MGAGVTRKSMRLGEDPRWDSVSFAQLAAASSQIAPITSTSSSFTPITSSSFLPKTTTKRCFPGDEFCVEGTKDVAPTQAEIDASRARADAANELSFPKSGVCPNGRRWEPTLPCTAADAAQPTTSMGICRDGSRVAVGQPCPGGENAADPVSCPDGSMAYPGSCPAPSGGGRQNDNEDAGSNTLLIAAGAVGFGALLLFVLRRQRQAR